MEQFWQEIVIFGFISTALLYLTLHSLRQRKSAGCGNCPIHKASRSAEIKRLNAK